MVCGEAYKSIEFMKCCIIYIGAIRECANSIKENILYLKESFNSVDVDIIFSTWNPVKTSYFIQSVNYVYDYDINNILNQIDGITNLNLFFNQKLINEYYSCSDGFPPLFLYNLIEIAKHLKKENKQYDYIIRSRHDNKVKIKNSEKYFNKNTYTMPAYQFSSKEKKYSLDYTSGHFFITKYENFLKLSDLNDNTIKNWVQNSINAESVDSKMLKYISEDISFIDDLDVLFFQNRNLPERIWINNL